MARNPRRLQKLVALARPDENSAGFLDWHIVLAICEELQPANIEALLLQLWPEQNTDDGEKPTGDDKVWVASVFDMWRKRAFKDSISRPPKAA